MPFHRTPGSRIRTVRDRAARPSPTPLARRRTRPERGRRATVLAAAFALATTAATGCGHGDSKPGSGVSSATPPVATGTVGEPTATSSPTQDLNRFQARVDRLTAKDLPSSWHSGCPVPPSGLRMIVMNYWGMDGRPHPDGKLVVNASAASDLVKVFRKLFENKYPIRKMVPVDAYKGSDYDSIDDDNTSAFNCRNATGSDHWSQHAYGLAVDVNPCENPYVTASGHIDHDHCVKFGERSRRDPGLIHAGDATVKAFGSIGWGWGGSWDGTRDYQHFSSSGR
ncbi:M15 family metallopeptidase [Actinomadura gamaensis]|uniref:M15 family metallopeptidase n=1 Tax=Actinomadura gamaensis TaxID=1763541 RepID=A0ABV9TWL2_9ACTN